MAEIVNLRWVKKARAAEAEAAQAQQNRVRFGRTGEAKARDRLERERSAKQTEGARLDKTEEEAT